jgi:hypothetical protein
MGYDPRSGIPKRFVTHMSAFASKKVRQNSHEGEPQWPKPPKIAALMNSAPAP